MKIYAVRDRMIDYFLMPFAAPSDNEVMASLSNEINRPDNINAIAQAPHHFELYQLGEIDENGTIFPKKELVCDCSNLVRPRRETAKSEAGVVTPTTGTPRGEAGRAESAASIATGTLSKGA